MRERGIELKVGILILVTAAVLVGFIFVLGNCTLASGYVVHVDYNFIGDLQPGAQVKVSGIKLGKVEGIHFLGGKINPRTGERVQVRVDVWIDDSARKAIRQDAQFYINTAGVLGAQYVEIVPGTDYKHSPLQPGAIVRGVDPPRTDLVVARLYDVLESVSDVLRQDRDVIRNLLSNSADAAAELNTFLKNNSQPLGELVVSANQFAGETAGVMHKLNEGITDPQAIGQTITNLQSLVGSADTTLRAITPPLEQFLIDVGHAASLITEQRLDRALKAADGAVALSGKASRLVENINGLVTYIRRGKGTVGALLVRDEIYADLREMIEDLKRNPWKLFWKE